jgi:hypothetical protein
MKRVDDRLTNLKLRTAAPAPSVRASAKKASRLRKASIQLGGVAAISALLLGAAPAPTLHGTIQGTNAAVTHLAPGVGAFTYWMNGPHGDVITLVHASRNSSGNVGVKDSDFVLRFSTVLAPGQSQTISVPGIDWGNPPTIRIRRRGDTIEVTSSNVAGEGSNL